MRKKGREAAPPPTAAQLEQELRRETYRRRYSRVLRSTIYTLITVAAIAVLVATLFLPVLRIYGTSMTPTMTDGDIVVSLKGGGFDRGDIIAFWFNNKILVKRVIAHPGEWVDIDEAGNVSIDGRPLDEPYLHRAALSGAGRAAVRHGRPPLHLLGQPQHRGGLRGGGADCGKAGVPGLAPGRIRTAEVTERGGCSPWSRSGFCGPA